MGEKENNDKLGEFKLLLSKVSAISNKYEEIAKITGANYNVFNILGLSTREVRTHSAFIADLLNPKGSHGKGDVFLKLFVEQINQSLNNKDIKINSEEFIKEKSSVEVEKHIGIIPDKDDDGITKENAYTEGGNIDIIIEYKNKNKSLIIENKIYAVDQRCQLIRYYNYGIKQYTENNFSLLYLTLHEQEASACSVNCNDVDCKNKYEINRNIIASGLKTKLEKDKDYFNITYKEDILNWLKECHKETTNHPFLRETLTQYINLIKQLTGQAMSDDMNNEIVKYIISSNDNIKNVFNLPQTINNVKYTLFNEIITIVKDLGFKNSEKLGNNEDAYIDLEENCKLIIAFKTNYDDFIIGIEFPENYSNSEYINELKRKIGEIGPTEEWPNGNTNKPKWFICRPKEYKKWNVATPWIEVNKKDGGGFKTLLQKVVNAFEENRSN